MIMVTFTVRHKRHHTLKRTLEGLIAARRKMLQGRKARDFDQVHGIAGRVKAVEVTHSFRNGWHPHLHELWFLEPGHSLPVLIPAIQAAWKATVAAVGLGTVNQHGVSVELAQWSVAEYVAKFGRDRAVEPDWHLEHEITKANSKEGREGARTPTGLLAAYAWEGDEEAGELWREYATTLKGKQQLTWTKGLRKLLGLKHAEKQHGATDDELMAEETRGATHLVSLTRQEWAAVVGNDARAELLQVAASGSVDQIAEYLHRLGVWARNRSD